ncbi:M24 family metallopeptidase [Alicyclobacillus fastidiosus]|uniref:M24 family metallopeptidase n=1 Tax=Alicyclobacillus fastidiosus TaxID=392011 RepID=A0ABV5ADA2_9BACL|nr:M24 family metallopeptidase [Alicyclobacillus fastidiosus]WEH08732.1 M24 family metallopeptidase [Alicyclobacillus fastidiosus]
MERQLALCRELMNATGLDALLLRTRSNFAWMTDGRDNHIEIELATGVADIVVFQDRVVVVTAEIEARRIAEEEIRDLPVELVSTSWTEGVDPTLESLLRGRRVGADVPFPGATLVGPMLTRLRRRLGLVQMEQYKGLCLDAAQVIEEVAKNLEPGQTEFSIGGQLMQGIADRGCTPHVVLVATDERIFRYRHPIPTEKRLDKYAMLVLCARRHGLIANVTRFVHFGELPDELRENKEKCAYIDVRMNEATRPGNKISDVFQTAISAYAEVGYPDDWRLLHQGGPTGYASREFLATQETHDVIQTNEAYAWNPAVRGIKSEDTVLVGEDGNTFLTQTGTWPYISVEYAGKTVLRPDILVR